MGRGCPTRHVTPSPGRQGNRAVFGPRPPDVVRNQAIDHIQLTRTVNTVRVSWRRLTHVACTLASNGEIEVGTDGRSYFGNQPEGARGGVWTITT